MNFGDARSDANATGFQIAPLIDIVFLLLIWMIVSYAVAEEEKSLHVSLPRADSAVEQPRRTNDLYLNVAADGALTLERRPITLEALERRLIRLREFARAPDVNREPGVILRIDGATPHRAVVAVLDVCGRAQIRRVFFATEGGGRTPAVPDGYGNPPERDTEGQVR